MFFKGFSASISGKIDDNGYVRMNHEEEYCVRLRNDTWSDADAEIKIDGKVVGQWRIPAQSSISLERPVDEARKFTFLKLDSAEGRDAGLGRVSAENLGLVQVTFKPKKRTHHSLLPLESMDYHPITWGSPKGSYKYCSTRSASAGGTGLGNHSNQEFGSTTALETDPNDWVQISLRLTLAGKYGEIRPHNQTKVPKPI